MKISSALLIVGISASISVLALAADDHAQHRSSRSILPTAQKSTTEPVAEKPLAEIEKPSSQAQQAAFPDLGSMSMAAHMSRQYYSMIRIDHLEAQQTDSVTTADTALVWDAKASWGRDFDKINLGIEGEALAGEIQHSRTDLFWSHALLRWWETSVGARYDDNSDGEDRTWAALGVQGMAPYFVHITATMYAADEERSALKATAEYDIRFSDRLFLQPSLELNAYGKDDAANAIAKGISDSEFGLRLRYEIRREIAPYIGVEWSRKYNATADLARAAGERTGEARALAGIRLWY